MVRPSSLSPSPDMEEVPFIAARSPSRYSCIQLCARLQSQDRLAQRYSSRYSHASSIPLFPQEIFDQIIDQLRENPTALRHCTLTCHAWLHRSSLHLFHLVRVHNEQIPAFRRALQRSSGRRLLLYITGLWVYTGPEDISDILASLEKLEVLQVVASRSYPDRINLPPTGRSLRQLQMKFLSESATTALMSAFESIDELVIQGCTFVDQLFSVSVRELFTFSCQPPTVPLLQNASSLTTLGLGMAIGSLYDVAPPIRAPELSHLLRNVSQSLEVLEYAHSVNGFRPHPVGKSSWRS